MLCPAASFTALSMQFLSYLELLGASSQVDSGSLEFALSIKNKGFPFEFIYLTILELLSTPEVIPRDRKNSKTVINIQRTCKDIKISIAGNTVSCEIPEVRGLKGDTWGGGGDCTWKSGENSYGK